MQPGLRHFLPMKSGLRYDNIRRPVQLCVWWWTTAAWKSCVAFILIFTLYKYKILSSLAPRKIRNFLRVYSTSAFHISTQIRCSLPSAVCLLVLHAFYIQKWLHLAWQIGLPSSWLGKILQLFWIGGVCTGDFWPCQPTQREFSSLFYPSTHTKLIDSSV